METKNIMIVGVGGQGTLLLAVIDVSMSTSLESRSRTLQRLFVFEPGLRPQASLC